MEVKEWLKDAYFSDGSQTIFTKDGHHIADIRGWGELQHKFPDLAKAGEFQDQVGQFVAEAINEKITGPTGSTSDGYHTFDELYDFRKMYNAILFNEWAADYMVMTKSYEGVPNLHPEIQLAIKNTKPKYNVHKSVRHHDGEPCFGGGWFVVVAILPNGQITNHYKMEDWDLFNIPETVCALYPYDGHTAQDVLARMQDLVGIQGLKSR